MREKYGKNKCKKHEKKKNGKNNHSHGGVADNSSARGGNDGSCMHRSEPSQIETYKTNNAYIIDGTDISGHRSGGGIEPEETMMAFKNC